MCWSPDRCKRFVLDVAGSRVELRKQAKVQLYDSWKARLEASMIEGIMEEQVIYHRNRGGLEEDFIMTNWTLWI